MKRTLDLSLSAARKKIILFNDLYPAVILIFTGIISLKEGNRIPLAALNILSGGTLLLFGIIEWRSLGKRIHRRIQWFDIACGAVMMFDTVMMYKPWKGFQPAYLYALLSFFLILKGFSLIRPPAIRRLTVNEESFNIRTGPFSRLHCSWNEMQKITLNGGVLEATTTSGVMTISLRKIANAAEVSTLLSEACAEKQVPFLSS